MPLSKETKPNQPTVQDDNCRRTVLHIFISFIFLTIVFIANNLDKILLLKTCIYFRFFSHVSL